MHLEATEDRRIQNTQTVELFLHITERKTKWKNRIWSDNALQSQQQSAEAQRTYLQCTRNLNTFLLKATFWFMYITETKVIPRTQLQLYSQCVEAHSLKQYEWDYFHAGCIKLVWCIRGLLSCEGKCRLKELKAEKTNKNALIWSTAKLSPVITFKLYQTALHLHSSQSVINHWLETR